MASLRDLVRAHGANVRGADRHHGDSLTIEGHELNFERLAVVVNVNNRPNVTALQGVRGQRRSQDDSIELVDHADGHCPHAAAPVPSQAIAIADGLFAIAHRESCGVASGVVTKVVTRF